MKDRLHPSEQSHLSDGELRASLDGELAEAGIRHLEACPACQARLPGIQQTARAVSARLSYLALQNEDRQPKAPAVYPALARLKNQLSEPKETNMFKKLFTTRSVWIGLSAVILLAVAFSVPTVRVWAGQFLGLFRIQQITVVPVDSGPLNQLQGDSTLGKQISELMSKSVTVTQQPGKPQSAADAAEAGQLAGFTVRLPDNQPAAPQLVVHGRTAFSALVDRARVQALLDETGRTDLKLPESIDGANIAIDIPASVIATYGTCPTGGDEPGSGSVGRRYPDCVVFTQIPSPTVTTPPNIDLQQLAEIALQVSGMTAQQAKDFSQTVDWTTSLVIPIPKNAATYEQVTVDGVTGTLIQRPVDDAAQYLLLWVKDGIVYAIGALGSDTQRAIDMANSLK